MIRVYLATIIILVVCACHKEKDNSHREFTSEDRDFMIAASYANRAQVALGTWAVMKGSTESVRSFGQTMALTYQQSQNELFNLADTLRDILPHQPDQAHLAYATQLSALSGHVFDSTYITDQISELQLIIEIFELKINSEGDPQVMDYAIKYLPQIKNHLQGAILIKQSL